MVLAYVISVKQQGFRSAEGQGTSTSSSSKVTLGECAALWIARHEELRMTFFQVRQVPNRLKPSNVTAALALRAWRALR